MTEKHSAPDWQAIADRANRRTLAYALAYARAAREAGDEETAAQFDLMAAHMQRKLNQP